MAVVRVNIEAERARLQLTKKELSAKVGISMTTYASYISGTPIPSDKLLMLADLFGVSCDYLLGRNDRAS